MGSTDRKNGFRGFRMLFGFVMARFHTDDRTATTGDGYIVPFPCQCRRSIVKILVTAQDTGKLWRLWGPNPRENKKIASLSRLCPV